MESAKLTFSPEREEIGEQELQDKKDKEHDTPEQGYELVQVLDKKEHSNAYLAQEQSTEQIHEEANERKVMERSFIKELQEQESGERHSALEQSDKNKDEISSNIEQFINELERIMDIQYRLFDRITSTNILSNDQITRIKEKDTNRQKVRQFLEEVIKEPFSDEKKTKFFEALDQTQQQHVSNFIRGKGQRVTEYKDDWPLLYCFTELQSMDTNKSSFIDLVDAKNGLLDELLTVGCIDHRKKHSVEASATDEAQNELLFEIIRRGSLANYRLFTQCLLETKQHPVLSLLEPNRAPGVRPLTDTQQSQLKFNYSKLVQLIDSKNGLVTELYAADCITWRQKEYIESAPRESESNIRLLDIVRRGSETDFDKFIECLNKTAQRHIVELLSGTVARIVATISVEREAEQHERRIVDQLNALLSNTSDQRMEELFDAVRQRRMNDLRDNGVTIVAANIESSIGLYFFVQSLEALHYLHEVYSTQQLSLMIQDIFVSLLNSDAAVNVRVVLKWDPSNYSGCLQRMCLLVHLPILSHVYRMAKRHQELIHATDTDPVSFNIDDFPFELVEMLLTSTAGHLFVTINRWTPRAGAAYTLATLCAVSKMWWMTFTGRRFTKRRLKRSFRRHCRPFRCDPRSVTSLDVGGENVSVMGVAEFNSKLYVACVESARILVFDFSYSGSSSSSSSSFDRLEDIELEELNNPSNIAVNAKTNELYVADWGAQCAIWRVNLQYGKQIDKFIATQWKPRSISVNSSRLLIIPQHGESLYLYSDDGQQSNHVELPRFICALHAVETVRKTYIVGHWHRFVEDLTPSASHGVTEVDVNGNVVRMVDSGEQTINCVRFNQPRYLLLDIDGHVIVADALNKRLVLLNADLKMERILMDSLKGQPKRLCLTTSRCLFICYYYSTCIDVLVV